MTYQVLYSTYVTRTLDTNASADFILASIEQKGEQALDRIRTVLAERGCRQPVKDDRK